LSLSIAKAFEFNCEFSETFWVVINNVYTCRPEISVSESALTIRGNHSIGRTDSDVEGLNIMSQEIIEIPEGIEKFFPNLRAIQVYDSNLESLSANILKQFSKLNVFSIQHNKVKSFDGNLFQGNLQLRYIIFFQNGIQHVGNNLFANLNDLELAGLQDEICINRVETTKEKIQELSDQLPIKCPPLATEPTTVATTTVTATTTTTTEMPSSECSSGCIDKMMEIVEAQEKRILELEKQMREISANPCSRG
jgi:hypothetical protein